MKKSFTSVFAKLLLLVVLSLVVNKQLAAQTYWYYNGTGALNATTSWGSNTNGSGSNPADFTTAATQYFVIQNATAVSLTGTWTVSGSGDKVFLGNPLTATPSAPTPAIALTLTPGAVLTVPSTSFDISSPASASATVHHKIIYQNASTISIGTINDANLELVFDGANLTTTTTKTYGDISLINGANVTMGNGTSPLVLKNLTVDASSTLSGPIGSSSAGISILAGGVVTINGTFKSGRLGSVTTNSLYTPNIVPGSTATSNGALLYQDLTVTQGANLILGNASTIEYNRGTSGQTGTQTVAALNYANLVLSNSAVASNKAFATSGTVSVSGTMTINLLATATITAPTQNINLLPGAKLLISSATAFATGGKLILQSDATATASIGAIASGGSITGNVTVQQYIPAGFRKYRFLSHPFTTSQSLSQLTDNIDITGNALGTTGQAGQTLGTGFTATPTNNPSAYFFNTASADGGVVNDGGWAAFTDASTSNWAKGQGIRVLIRGTKGQAGTLDGTNASPAAVTLDMTGAINTGAVSVNLVTGGSGSTAGFNLVGNPYPSPVDIGAVLTAAAANIGSSFYVRNPQTGSYLTINPIPATYTLPANSAFFVKATANTSLSFAETNKSICSTCPTVFRTAGQKNRIELKAFNSGIEYDNFYLNLDDSYNNMYEEKNDAIKLINDGLNIYALSTDKQKLAADYSNTKDSVIPMGIMLPQSYGVQTYTLKVADYDLFAIPSTTKLMLHDKLLNKYIQLEKDASYDLLVDPSNSNSIGENRLELVFIKSQPAINILDGSTITVTSNHQQFIVRYTNAQASNTTVRLLTASGQLINKQSLGNQQQGQCTISATNLAEGLYFIEVQIGNEKTIKKIVK